jgi:RHS repeat-associated protein
LGKVLTSQQITDGNTYETLYIYDSFGKLLTETYPSGRVVKNEFDTLGRIASVSSKASVSASQPSPVFHIYANGFGYNDKGQPDRMRLGNGLWESIKYNNKFQVTQLGLGTSQSNANRLKIEYEYGEIDSNGNLDISKNNGNVARQKITVPTIGASQGFVATQSYEYDELNRLKSAVETSNSQTNWEQHFRYDRYGNRTVITEQNRVGQEAFTTSSIVGPNPDINIANNRIVPKPNSTEQYLFDASGNMTRDAVGNLYSYDAENHQTQYFESNNTTTPNATYFYDGDGRRVKKIVKRQEGQQTVDETTLFVYDGGGALVAEYTQNAPANTNPQTVYLTADTLGSPRINTNEKGQVVARHDYLPFGDEIIGLGQRIQHQEYVDDDVRKKFTGYEKDKETGLDFAQARYYGNGLGRFTSVDPLLESAKVSLPQSWNRYSYVLNNPLNLIDPDGERWFYKYNYVYYGKNRYISSVEVTWVNPNDDGTYVSPGAGWEEFIPTKEKPYLSAWTEGCYCTYTLGENPDGSPKIDGPRQTGAVQNLDGDVLAAIVLGKASQLVLSSIFRYARVAWAAYLASKAVQPAEETGTKIATATAKRLFSNLFPEDKALPYPRSELIFDGKKWRAIIANGKTITPNGEYNFVIQEGKIFIGRGKFGKGGHVDLSKGLDVEYAGRIRFGHGNNAGNLRYWNNRSGHFWPEASFSYQAPLPQNLFRPVVK